MSQLGLPLVLTVKLTKCYLTYNPIPQVGPKPLNPKLLIPSLNPNPKPLNPKPLPLSKAGNQVVLVAAVLHRPGSLGRNRLRHRKGVSGLGVLGFRG